MRPNTEELSKRIVPRALVTLCRRDSTATDCITDPAVSRQINSILRATASRCPAEGVPERNLATLVIVKELEGFVRLSGLTEGRSRARRGARLERCA